MIEVFIRTNGGQTSVTAAYGDTLRSAFESAGVDYSNANPRLDGMTLSAGDLDRTFTDFGITATSCYLTAVAKVDNA